LIDLDEEIEVDSDVIPVPTVEITPGEEIDLTNPEIDVPNA